MSDVEDPAGKQLREHMLQAMVEASLSDHELSGWEPMNLLQTYTAACIRCGQQVRVSPLQIQSELSTTCRVRDVPDRLLSALRAAAHLGDETRFQESYLALLAHFSDFTLVQLTTDADLEPIAFQQLPDNVQRSIGILRRLLQQKLDDKD